MAGRRPEYSNPPEQYYDQNEARKYSSNSHIIRVQGELSRRAYDLLELPEGEPMVLLDIGCGSGLSGEVLSENGHEWIGIDISEHMLRVAKEDNEAEGDLVLIDMGCGVPFKPGCFDGAISISAIQWLCHSNSNDENPVSRLFYFFQTLYSALARGARAVFQFYPESHEQCKLICQQATKAGFRGGLVVDYPESKKAVKPVLCALKELKIISSTSVAPRVGIASSAHSPQRFVNMNMLPSLTTVELGKLAAARACVENEVKSGMRIGVGSGSTVKFLIECLREACLSGKLTNIQCVPTSYQTTEWLRKANLPIQSLDTLHELDVTIDGADEVDEKLTCIKGGGGCLLQEKIVQLCAKKFVIIADGDKLSMTLGTNYKFIPIEVVSSALAPVKKWITECVGGECVLRMDQRKCFPTITENHNNIFDWDFPKPVSQEKNWHQVHQELINITGVVETGLFIGVAQVAYFGKTDGTVQIVKV